MDFANNWFGDDNNTASEYCLRFRDTGYLKNDWTPVNHMDEDWTFSCWFKGSPYTGMLVQWDAGPNGNNKTAIYGSRPETGEAGVYRFYSSGGSATSWNDNMVGRYYDENAWNHIVINKKSGGNTAPTYDMWMNGHKREVNVQSPNININASAANNVLIGPNFGSDGGVYKLHDFRMYNQVFVDGSLLPPTKFGYFDMNGVWRYKEPQVDTPWGDNGYYLNFKDESLVNYTADEWRFEDQSPNGNHFKPWGGMSLTDSSDLAYDRLKDSPFTNSLSYSSLTQYPNTSYYGIPTWDNLVSIVNAPSVSTWAQVPFSTPIKGKKYIEFTAPYQGSPVYRMYGITSSRKTNSYPGGDANSWGYYSLNGELYHNSISTPHGATWQDNTAIGVAFDADNYKLDFYRLGVKQGPTIDVPPGEYFFTSGMWNSGNYVRGNAQPLYFPDAVPEGYEMMYAANMPSVPIANGRDHFQAITDTGANILTAAQTAFPNGLWWIKDRSNSNQHQLLTSNSSFAFTCPQTALAGAYVPPTGESVAWCWNNADPATSGFQLKNGISEAAPDQRFDHDLGVEPEFIIALTGQSSEVQYHPVYHKDATGWLQLNDDAAQINPYTNLFPTITSTQVGLSTLSNSYEGDPIALAMWRSVPGYSAFGSYEGNNSTDGPFIYTGFRPAFIMIKGLFDSPWIMLDSTRYSSNTGDVPYLFANKDFNEAISPAVNGYPDFYSNGFKVRGLSSGVNASNSYIYMAFAENPFGGSNVPCVSGR